MKECTKCGSSENGFRKKLRNDDGLDTFCKICRREADKTCYNNNLEKNREDNLIRKNKSRLRNKDFIVEYLENNPCVDCGESDIIVLEFDHLENKKKNISLMMDSSLEKIKEEISKCEVRCANCHRRKTAKEFGFYKLKL